jgi:two-component system KDP operon response regulator KdpE
MKILVVDPDRSLVEAITIGLELHWDDVQVLSAADGEIGLDLFWRESPDLTLLDVNLPGTSGWAMLRQARAESTAPVIILTARGQELDKVKGLELGADDYLTKPFSHLELFARIKAVLRRTHGSGPRHALLAFAGDTLIFNFTSRTVTAAGTVLQLTPTEYNLLTLLARNAGRVVPSDWLCTRIWGREHRAAKDYLKTYISRLRHKLGDDPATPRYIRTEHRVGYCFALLPTTGGVPAGLHA